MTQEMINAAIVVLMPYLVVGAISLFRLLVSKLPENKQAAAQQVAGVVVSAVEQLFATSPGTSEDKKAQAVKLAQSMLSDLGVKVSADTLSVLIENAVRALAQASQAPVESPVQPGA